MTNMVTVGGVTMTLEAARNLEAVGNPAAMVAADIAALRSGQHTEASLLAHCLSGADEARVSDWHDYVAAVTEAAGRR